MMSENEVTPIANAAFRGALADEIVRLNQEMKSLIQDMEEMRVVLEKELSKNRRLTLKVNLFKIMAKSLYESMSCDYCRVQEKCDKHEIYFKQVRELIKAEEEND